MQENFQKISNLRDRKDFVGFVLVMEASEYASRLPSLSDAKENIKKENGACGITPQAPFQRDDSSTTQLIYQLNQWTYQLIYNRVLHALYLQLSELRRYS